MFRIVHLLKKHVSFWQRTANSMADNLTTALVQQHKNPPNPPSHFSDNFVSSKEPLPYDPMLGWYTAATLSGLLVLFIACVGIEKIKDKIVSLFENRHLKRDNSIQEESLEDRAQMTLMMQEPPPLSSAIQMNSMPALPHHSKNYSNYYKDSNNTLNNSTINHSSNKTINDATYNSIKNDSNNHTSNNFLNRTNNNNATINNSSQEPYTTSQTITLDSTKNISQTNSSQPSCNLHKQICIKANTQHRSQKFQQNSTFQSAISTPQHFSYPSLPSPVFVSPTDPSHSSLSSHLPTKSPSSPSLPSFLSTPKPSNPTPSTSKHPPIGQSSCEPFSHISPLLDI